MSHATASRRRYPPLKADFDLKLVSDGHGCTHLVPRRTFKDDDEEEEECHPVNPPMIHPVGATAWVSPEVYARRQREYDENAEAEARGEKAIEVEHACFECGYFGKVKIPFASRLLVCPHCKKETDVWLEGETPPPGREE